MFNALPNINFKDSKNFFLIAGPCAIEGEQMAMDIAGKIVEITNELEIPYIFKGSFKKANPCSCLFIFFLYNIQTHTRC